MHNNDNEHESQDNDIESLHSALHKAHVENEQLQSLLSTYNDELGRVCNECDTLRSDKDELESCLTDKVEQLQAELNKQMEKS